MSRIITIIDAEPITVTSLSIASSSGNNFARADQNIIITLETNSSNIANAIGTILSKTFTNSFTGGSASTYIHSRSLRDFMALSASAVYV